MNFMFRVGLFKIKYVIKIYFLVMIMIFIYSIYLYSK